MYIAMNRFRVKPGKEDAFEDVWRSRRSRLRELRGFEGFSLLRGPKAEDHTLYASHTVWASQDDFLAWTKSEQFRDAHRNAGQGEPLTLGHPVFEGFEAVQSIGVGQTDEAA